MKHPQVPRNEFRSPRFIISAAKGEGMFTPAEIWSVAQTEQGHAVLLRPTGTDVVIPIFIGYMEAQSIVLGLGNVPTPRPLTHDLMINLMNALGGQILKVEVCAIKETTFFARIIIESPSGETSIDARPSDALALASRLKTPIFIEESIVSEAAVPIEVINAQANSTLLNLEEMKKDLQNQLSSLIAEEKYEEAARVRDRLHDLETGPDAIP
jgi:bifunctional DNase/RNase